MATVSLGNYAFVRLLGKGGMSEVYEAAAENGRRVAVKVFSVDRPRSEFLKKRFVAEAQILRRLSHPNLVRVWEMGLDAATQRPYYAMDLVLNERGEPMTLETRRRAGALTEEEIERWYREILQAVAYCHAHGVVHRDIKLENVLLNEKGQAILSDFGISRILDKKIRSELQVATTFIEGETTGTKPVMGTYWYLAPEIRKGAPATPASDWYAVGVLFFRLLTGMWYEPGTQAMDLLAPYDRRWRTRLSALLSDDPSARVVSEALSVEAPRLRRVSRLVRLGVCVLLPILAGGAMLVVWNRTRAPIASLQEGKRFSLDYDGHVRFDFAACLAGTNTHGKVAVTITNPYALGITPVTRRQWYAVMGHPLESWPGGEDAPMTYVSRDEVTNFCAYLNQRFADRLPRGCEIRLPTVAEWQLAYVTGKTEPDNLADKREMRKAYDVRGWFGRGLNGESASSGMRTYYANLDRPVPMVTNIWTDFPPRVISPGQEEWMRWASQVPPVPVGLKPANALGLKDMLGNCSERLLDTCSDEVHHWGKTEWAVTTKGLYGGQGLSVTNPVERSGSYPLMLGSYLALDLSGNRVWSAPFDRLPHLGFRLCLGPRIPTP